MRTTIALLSLALLSSCQPAADGAAGVLGPQGPAGPMGAMGTPGRDGAGVVPAALGRSGSRIKFRAEVFALEDGAVSEGARTLWDSKLEVPCVVRMDEVGALRCLPAEAALPGVATGYADAACTRALRGFMPGKAYKYTADVTQGRHKMHLLGPKIAAPATYYLKTSEGCAATALPSGLDWYEALGAAVSPAEFVAAEQKTLIE